MIWTRIRRNILDNIICTCRSSLRWYSTRAMPRERKPASCLNTKSISGRLGTYWPCVLYFCVVACTILTVNATIGARWNSLYRDEGEGEKLHHKSSPYKRSKQDIRLLECWQRHDAMRVPWASIRDRITEISSPRANCSAPRISPSMHYFCHPPSLLNSVGRGKENKQKKRKNPVAMWKQTLLFYFTSNHEFRQKKKFIRLFHGNK
jgi:hypothetical protein